MATDAGSDRTEADKAESAPTSQRPPALDAAHIVLGSPGLGPRDGLPGVATGSGITFPHGAATMDYLQSRGAGNSTAPGDGMDAARRAVAAFPSPEAGGPGNKVSPVESPRSAGEQLSIQQSYSYLQSEPGEDRKAATRDADGAGSQRPAGGRKAGPPDGKGGRKA